MKTRTSRKWWTVLAAMICLLAPGIVSAEKVKVEVQGMVCSFCAHGISAKLREHDAVEKFTVSLTRSTVTIEIKEGHSLEDKEITAIIEDSGFKVNEIKRGEEAVEAAKAAN